VGSPAVSAAAPAAAPSAPSAPAFGQPLEARPLAAPSAAEALAAPPAPAQAPAPAAPTAPAESSAPSGSVPTSTFATLAALKPLVTRPRSEHAVEQGGGELTKRVRGAQLPDGGEPAAEQVPVRGADDVRSTLTSLQRGIDLGRQHGGEA
jgi:hypothetical protein